MSGKLGSGYPSDVTDEEWQFVLPYLLLCREDSLQRRHDLRRVFNGVRYAARTGGQWRYLPHEYGPWWAVYQQMRRWLDAGVFEVLVADVQSIVREWAGRKGQPTAICIDSRTLQSDAGKRCSRGLRRRQAAQGLEGPHRCRYAGPPAGGEGHGLPIEATANRLPRSPPRCKRSPVQPWNWPMSTRATPDRTPPRPPKNMVSGSRWSNTLWPNEASCCCHVAGSWKEASPGPHASEDSHETTNGSKSVSKASTTSHSPSS